MESPFAAAPAPPLFRSGRIIALRPLLAAFAALSAVGCADDRGPPGEEIPEAGSPRTRSDGGVTRVQNVTPLEKLNLGSELPEDEIRLLFLDRTAATPTEGGSIWADPDGGRLLVFDARGAVVDMLQGGPEGGRPLTRPRFASAGGGIVEAVEGDGSHLRFEDGSPQRWRAAPLPEPVAARRGSVEVAARTIYGLQPAPIRPTDPLLWFHDREAGTTWGAGRVTVPDEGFLGPLVNAGWVAATDDGYVYASVVLPELRFFDPTGELVATAEWAPSAPVDEPRLVAENGTVTPRFTTLQTGALEGPDGRVYVLASRAPRGLVETAPSSDPRFEGREQDFLLVFERNGTLLRAGAVPRGAAVFADEAGRIFVTEAERAMTRTRASLRGTFPSFDLPGLDSGDGISLDTLRGRVVVLNFWASWCPPCRDEIPLLDRWATTLDPEEAIVVGVNEDVDAAAALRFLDHVGPIGYPMVAGGGRQRERYGYRGLPYTVVLDRDGRIARVFYGFGSSITPIEDAVAAELEGVPDPIRGSAASPIR